MSKINDLFHCELSVVNIGVESFYRDLVAQ